MTGLAESTLLLMVGPVLLRQLKFMTNEINTALPSIKH